MESILQHLHFFFPLLFKLVRDSGLANRLLFTEQRRKLPLNPSS